MISRDTHAPFRLATLDDLREAVLELGLDIPVDEDTSILKEPVVIKGRTVTNSMAIHPMEGCDGTVDGAPDDLTFRRYRRFAAGGAGLLWFEACAVVPEGRSNPRQLWLHESNKSAFLRLVEETHKAAPKGQRPLCVLQLTHSGRYSRPSSDPKPIIAHHDPLLDADRGISPDYPLVTDEYLEALEDRFVEAAMLAFEVGFDAVDIKSCHRYLLNELLAAHTREGCYGGSYENRTRFLKNVVRKVREAAGPERIVTCRLGVYDAHPYPHGWGVDPNRPTEPNLEEPKRLVRELFEMGVTLINITMGNPYFNPHVNRPYDRPVEGGVYPDEHPLVGVNRLINLTREIALSVPEMVVVGSGYSWLRNLWPHVAAANIRRGSMRIVGLGRQAFAYPGFANEIIETGKLERRHTCITCSSCTQIMRDGGRTGCVPFDSEIYGPIYREGRRRSLEHVKAQAARCRDCFDPTCRDGCPARVNVPGFVKALADGDIRLSYEILLENNALPELCAYVCPADVQCQAACIESIFSGSPIPIRELQEYVSRTAREKGWASQTPPPKPNKHEQVGRVAIIGAGPAGLACASRLLAMGHIVEVFDLRDNLGGVAASAIPSERLAESRLVEEVSTIIGKFEPYYAFHGGEGLSEARNLDWFVNHYDAVFLATGLGDSTKLDGERPEGVEDAISFLERVKRGDTKVAERVAVLGGGNTAMDAAVTAASCGALDVYLVYRRSFAEMPAWPSERDQALKMGVHFLLLTQPIRYVADETGRLKGLVIARTVLAPPTPTSVEGSLVETPNSSESLSNPSPKRSEQRRRPVIVPDSESILEVEMALEALGQRLPEGFEQLIPGVELTDDRLIKVDDYGRTSRAGVFAGGDVTNGGSTVVQAVADGMRAAEAINNYIQATRCE